MNKAKIKMLAMGAAFCLPAVLLAVFGKLDVLAMGLMLMYGVLSGGLFYIICLLIGDWKERNSTVAMLDKRLGEVMNDNVELRKNLQETVVKISKGDVRVEADGKVLDKRFKSMTQANEWYAIHKK